MSLATSVEPVKMTPAMRESATSAAPIVSPRPGRNCSAAAGTPARWKRRTVSYAMSGVCSAGFAMTALPAASAALTWPAKIASGKFHGEIATMRSERRGGRHAEIGAHLRRVIAQEVRRFTHLRHGVRERLSRFAHREREKQRPFVFEEIGGALEAVGAVGGRHRRPA